MRSGVGGYQGIFNILQQQNLSLVVCSVMKCWNGIEMNLKV